MQKDLFNYVIKFQKGLIDRREFIKYIQKIIMVIPQNKGYFDHDLKYDFFSLVLSRLDKIISRYKVRENCKFETWLYFVLNREFLNFMKKKSNLMKKGFDECSLNEEIIYKNNDEKDDTNELLNLNFSFLTEKEKNIIAYKYGIEIENRDISETVKCILNKMDKRKKIENKILVKYQKIIKIQKEIISEDDRIKKEKFKDKEMNLKRNKRRLEKILFSYSILPSNTWVADKLGLSSGTIGAYIFKIKNKLNSNYFCDINKKAN